MDFHLEELNSCIFFEGRLLRMLTLMKGEGTALFRRNTLVSFCVANDISKRGVEILWKYSTCSDLSFLTLYDVQNIALKSGSLHYLLHGEALNFIFMLLVCRYS